MIRAQVNIPQQEEAARLSGTALPLHQVGSVKSKQAAGRSAGGSQRTIGFFLSSVQDMGGAQRVAISLANRLCNEYRVVIIERITHESVAFPLDERVSVVSLGGTAQRFREQFKQVRKPLTCALKEHHVDVLMGICVEESAMALLPCKAAKTKLVFCDHGALINQLDDKTTTLLRNMCAHFCDKAVVLTSQSAKDYQRLLHIPARKLEVIPNWVSNELLREAPLCAVEEKRILFKGLRYGLSFKILVEEAGCGIGFLQEMQRRYFRSAIMPVRPAEDKETRLQNVTPALEAGRCFLPKDGTVWEADFKHEVLGFPNTKHDDQVDALSQLLSYWKPKTFDFI